MSGDGLGVASGVVIHGEDEIAVDAGEAGAEGEPGAHPVLGALAEGDQALLAALAHHLEKALVQEDGEPGQPGQLRDPQARGVEELDPGPVPDAQGRKEVRGGEEGFHLGFREGPGQDPGGTGRPDHGLGARGAFALHAQEAQEGAQGRGQAGHAPGGLAPGPLGDQEGGKPVPVQPGGGQVGPGGPQGEVLEVGEVA